MEDVLAKMRKLAAKESRGGRPREGVAEPPSGRTMPPVDIPGVPGLPDARWTGGKRGTGMRAPKVRAPGVGGGGPHG